MIRQISKILAAVEAKREEDSKKKMMAYLDWRSETVAKKTRNANLSRLHR